MKVQSNLDLCNFELQNFCVQSYTNTNNVEPTLARMLFVNGNENSELANRLVIHNGTGWKGFAYLDDLTTFKDEDFNALKEKVELLSGDVDTDAIINNMKDVEAFLEGFTESQTLMDLLNSKLDKTGGTIEGTGSDLFSINRKDGNPYINFYSNGNLLGRIGFNTNGELIASVNNAIENIIHSGNVESLIGDTYLKTDGSNTMGADAYIAWNSDSNGNDVSDWSTITGNGLKIISSISADSGAPTTYSTALHIKGRYFFKLAAAGGENDVLYFKNGSRDWKTIAFKDSNITGNAATATKLQTARTIWGQSFDGTNKVTGDLYLSPATDNGNALSTRLVFSGYSGMPYGPVIGTTASSTAGYGRKNLVFMQRNEETWATDFNSHTTAMLINPSGNITIGGSDLAGSDYKLLIHGTTKFTDNENTLGLYTRIKGSGIQVGRATASYMGGYNAGISYGEDDTSLSFIAGVYDNRETEETYFYYGGKYDFAPLYIRETYVGICNKPVNGYSLYVKGNGLFTATMTANKVLIGGAEDDTISALNVNGTTRVGDVYTIKGDAEWSSGFYSIDSSRNRLGGFGFHVKDSALVKAFIGSSFSSTWFTINSTESNFNVITNFNGGALIPTGQKMTFGADGPTMEYDADANAIKVTGNIYATGTLAAGGVAEEEAPSGGNATVYQYTLTSGQQTYSVQNVKGDVNVIVQVYEWNDNSDSWDMILTDVGVTASGITITFGRATTVNHMVTVC